MTKAKSTGKRAKSPAPASVKRKKSPRPEPEELIESDPKIMVGKPVVKGTRITVELILDKLAAGETIEQILDDHPTLTLEGVRAAIAFASKALRSDVIYPVSS